MTSSPRSGSVSGTVADLVAIARRVPGTIALVLTMFVIGAATGALWNSASDSGLVEQWGWSADALADGRVWTVVTGMLMSPEPWMYALIFVVLVPGAGFVEYFYGTWRMLAVAVGTQVAAVLLTYALFWLLAPLDVSWAVELAGFTDVGMSNAAFGLLGAATAAMPLLWRRRVRVGVGLYAVALLIYAAEIWDFTHAIAFAVGIAIGPLVVSRPYERMSWRLGRQEFRDLAALIVVFGTLHTVIAQLWPGEGGLLEFGQTSQESEALTVAFLGSSLFTLLIAYALHRGRRAAWWFALALTLITVVLLVMVVVVTGLEPAGWLELILDIALLAVLGIGWRAFAVRGSRAGIGRIWARGLILFAGLWAFGVVSILGLSASLTPEPGVLEAIAESTARIFSASTGITGDTVIAKVLLAGLSIAWFVAVAWFVTALLLQARRHTTDTSDREKFIALQDSTDTMTSIGYMARWEGIDHWISDDGTAAVGFAQVGTTAVVLSNPAGTRGDVARNLEGFADFCRSRGWRIAYFAVSDSVREDLEAQGYKSIQIAEDTVIDLPSLEFKGKSWQDVRSALNRAKREGVTMRTANYTEAPRGIKDQLEAISDQWSGDKSLPEMKFTLGGLEEAADPRVRMRLAVDADGTVHGMTSWLPVYRDGSVVGWTIDIMKRRLDDDAMPGVMEFLIAEAAVQFKEDGYEFISLSSAPLSFSGEPDGPVERLLAFLADAMEPYYGFASLDRFKRKFHPRHVPLHLCFRDEAELPALTLAILRAYLPDANAGDLVKTAVSRPS